MTAEVPAAKPPCEHYWAFHCYGGMSVRLCQTCHEPDWEDLRDQLAEAEQKGKLTERERVTGLAGRLKTVLAQPVNGYLVDAVPFAALLDVLAAGAVHRGERP